MAEKPVAELFQDETGARSSARVLLWALLAFIVAISTADFLLPGRDVPEPAYTLYGLMFTILGVWALGPRVAAYIGPQVGAIVQGLAMSRRTPSRDERPEPDYETMVLRGPR